MPVAKVTEDVVERDRETSELNWKTHLFSGKQPILLGNSRSPSKYRGFNSKKLGPFSRKEVSFQPGTASKHVFMPVATVTENVF